MFQGSVGDDGTSATGSEDESTAQDESTADTSSPTPAPVVNPNSPSRVLRRHFQRLSSGDYDGAFAVMSSAYRSANPGWTSERSAAHPYINVVQVGPSKFGAGVAFVHVTFYARDSFETKVSDKVCRKFDGQARMRKEGSEWFYDPGKGQYAVEEFTPPLQKCIR